MNALQTARIIAYCFLFLDLDEDEKIDADDAITMIEWMAKLMEDYDKESLRELIDAFAAIAPEFTGESQELVRNIARGCYLEESLVSDDPVAWAAAMEKRDAEGG